MQQKSTSFLRLSLLGIGTLGVLLCALMMSGFYREWPREFPHLENLRYLIVTCIAIACAAFVVALHQAFKLLNLIDADRSFSKSSVKVLQNIKYCAFVIAGVFTVGMPVVYHVAEKDDAPGLILIVGAMFIGAPIIVAVFAGVCQKLFHNAIKLKSENDLTV